MSEKGVKLNPGKVKAIVKLPAPKNVSEMHQLFGTIDYLGKFLPNLSDVRLWSFYKNMAPVPLPIQRRSKLR